MVFAQTISHLNYEDRVLIKVTEHVNLFKQAVFLEAYFSYNKHFIKQISSCKSVK